jgi:phage I-like protein
MPSLIKAMLSSEIVKEGSDLPLDIQYMPPGEHEINASSNGEPINMVVKVDAEAASRLDSYLQEKIEAAKAGSTDRPFFDFNHDDREAAAWPTEIYWGGDDKLTGGVRAKVEWSGAGMSAIKDKLFRRFSPSFIPDEEGRVISSDTNMGGLVNRAAFQAIQPLFAKRNDERIDIDDKSTKRLTIKTKLTLLKHGQGS